MARLSTCPSPRTRAGWSTPGWPVQIDPRSARREHGGDGKGGERVSIHVARALLAHTPRPQGLIPTSRVRGLSHFDTESTPTLTERLGPTFQHLANGRAHFRVLKTAQEIGELWQLALLHLPTTSDDDLIDVGVDD